MSKVSAIAGAAEVVHSYMERARNIIDKSTPKEISRHIEQLVKQNDEYRM